MLYRHYSQARLFSIKQPARSHAARCRARSVQLVNGSRVGLTYDNAYRWLVVVTGISTVSDTEMQQIYSIDV